MKNLITYIKEKINMADTAIRPKNYTDEMVVKMTEAYVANPSRETVEVLANEFGKSVRSIIAKLSREGVYVAQPKVTKTGEPVVRKAELVAQLEAHFEVAMPTLVKASKADLQKLVDTLS
tara:strand:- start:2752 stop:3111 length:360 start_codon:yes stop_codon:yes gene_type:complete